MTRSGVLPPIAALTGALALAGAARADEDPASRSDRAALLEQAFDSTIVSTYPDGRQAELWLHRDGTYAAEGRRRDHSGGTWQIKGDKLCLRQKRPFPAPFSYCTGVPEGGLDRPWRGKAYTGEAITIRLVHGPHGRDVKPTRAQAGSAEDRG